MVNLPTYINLTKVTKEASEIIVNEAIELWQEHGGPIGLGIADLPKQKWMNKILLKLKKHYQIFIMILIIKRKLRGKY